MQYFIFREQPKPAFFCLNIQLNMKLIILALIWLTSGQAIANVTSYDSRNNGATHEGSISTTHAFAKTRLECIAQNCGGGRSWTRAESTGLHRFKIVKVDDSAPNWSVPLLADFDIWTKFELPINGLKDFNLSASAQVFIYEDDGNPRNSGNRMHSYYIRQVFNNLPTSYQASTNGLNSITIYDRVGDDQPNLKYTTAANQVNFSENNVELGWPLYSPEKEYIVDYSAMTQIDSVQQIADNLGYYEPWIVSASAYADPVFRIDPTWKYANAFKIEIAPVPLPPSGLLFLASSVFILFSRLFSKNGIC